MHVVIGCLKAQASNVGLDRQFCQVRSTVKRCPNTEVERPERSSCAESVRTTAAPYCSSAAAQRRCSDNALQRSALIWATTDRNVALKWRSKFVAKTSYIPTAKTGRTMGYLLYSAFIVSVMLFSKSKCCCANRHRYCSWVQLGFMHVDGVGKWSAVLGKDETAGVL